MYLVNHDPNQPLWFYIFAFVFGLLGYYIFRSSNGLKDNFRTHFNTHPDRFKGLETMPTERGTRLITGGWWGLARKINYTADLMMALSWSLLCGRVLVPYFYPVGKRWPGVNESELLYFQYLSFGSLSAGQLIVCA